MRVIIAAAFLIVLLIGCSGPNRASAPQTASGVKGVSGARAQTRFTSAIITRRFDTSGMATNDKLTITDPEQLAVLESYFKEAGTGARGPQSGGWSPAVTVVLKPKLGRQVKVMTNYEVWSEGMGDWPMRAGFKDYVQRLFDQRKTL